MNPMRPLFRARRRASARPALLARRPIGKRAGDIRTHGSRVAFDSDAALLPSGFRRRRPVSRSGGQNVPRDWRVRQNRIDSVVAPFALPLIST